jgi:hypothetical protein
LFASAGPAFDEANDRAGAVVALLGIFQGDPVARTPETAAAGAFPPRVSAARFMHAAMDPVMATAGDASSPLHLAAVWKIVGSQHGTREFHASGPENLR